MKSNRTRKLFLAASIFTLISFVFLFLGGQFATRELAPLTVTISDEKAISESCLDNSSEISTPESKVEEPEQEKEEPDTPEEIISVSNSDTRDNMEKTAAQPVQTGDHAPVLFFSLFVVSGIGSLFLIKTKRGFIYGKNNG